MSALSTHVERIADNLDRRWGFKDADLPGYLERALRDAAIEIGQEAAFADEGHVAILTSFLAKHHDTDNPDDVLDFCFKAVQIVNAVESAGLKLPDLLPMFFPEKDQ